MRQASKGFIFLVSFLSLELRSQTFVDNSVGLPRLYGWATSLGDYDADGLLDVLCFDSMTQFEPSLYRLQENRVFARVQVPFAPNNQGWVNSDWADFNGDGRLDLLLSASSSSNQAQAAIWLQELDGTFTEQPFHPAGNPRAWADLDNDGRLDIISDSPGGGVIIYWNEPGIEFVTATQLPNPTSARSLELVDLDNDGDLDLALPLGTGRKMYRNDGYRHFVDTGILLGSGVFADMNGDGLLDCVYSKANQHTWSTIAQFNQGNFRFADTALDTGWGIFQVSQAADFDSDRLPDLFLIAYPRGVGDFPPGIYLNKSSPLFEPSKVTILPRMEIRSATVADFNGDGTVDFLGMGPDATGESHRHLFRNDTPVNWSLAAPVNLSAQVRRDSVDLAWEPGGSVPCTFNFRIGTSPGAQNIVSSASRADGRRLIPAMGNAQTSKRWHIGKLPPGTYYWAVQAVDWGFRGSPFSDEGRFTVVDPGRSPRLPVISELENVLTDEDTPTPAIRLKIQPKKDESDLTISMESDNPKLTPPSSFKLIEDKSKRWLVITPGENESGSTTVTIRVTDLGGQVATRSFLLTVAPINDPPVIDAIPTQVTYTGAPPLTVPLSIVDAESALPAVPIFPRPWPQPNPPPGAYLTLSAHSSDQQLVPDSGLRFVGSNLEVTPGTNRTGSVIIQVTVSDGEAATTTSFVLQILQQPFQPSHPLLAGANPLWADFNGDGRLDLLASQGWPRQAFTRLYLNSSNGLAESGVALPANEHGGIAAFDFDRDNDLDLLQVGPEAVFLLRNNGDATFVSVPAGSIPKLWFPVITPADVDNDGDLDFFLTGSVDGPIHTFRLYLNDNGTFRSASVPNSNAGGGFQVADIDHDGWLDLLFSGALNNTGTPRYGIYRGIGGGRFGPLEPFPPTFEALNGFGLADIDSDGWPDLWQQSTVGLRLYQNRSGVFQLVGTIQDQPFAWVQTQPHPWVDLDNDGDLDILTAANVLRNDADFDFTPLSSPLASFDVPGVSFADVNNDGALDALLSVYNRATFQFEGLQLYTNRSPALINSPPSAPSNLRASFQGQQVVLSWSPSLDMNQRSGFTYNVRVGTSPGSSDTLSAAALPDGKLLFVGHGNTGGGTSLILTNLTRESYYWSVQAVDNSFSGGPFAPEQRFLVLQPNNLPSQSVALSYRVQSGNPVFTVRGEPSASYVIESSADLQHWTASQLLSSESGEITFSPSSPLPPANFYRARRVD